MPRQFDGIDQGEEETDLFFLQGKRLVIDAMQNVLEINWIGAIQDQNDAVHCQVGAKSDDDRLFTSGPDVTTHWQKDSFEPELVPVRATSRVTEERSDAEPNQVFFLLELVSLRQVLSVVALHVPPEEAEGRNESIRLGEGSGKHVTEARTG